MNMGSEETKNIVGGRPSSNVPIPPLKDNVQNTQLGSRPVINAPASEKDNKKEAMLQKKREMQKKEEQNMTSLKILFH